MPNELDGELTDFQSILIAFEVKILTFPNAEESHERYIFDAFITPETVLKSISFPLNTKETLTYADNKSIIRKIANILCLNLFNSIITHIAITKMLIIIRVSLITISGKNK